MSSCISRTAVKVKEITMELLIDFLLMRFVLSGDGRKEKLAGGISDNFLIPNLTGALTPSLFYPTTLISYHLPEFSFFLWDDFFSASFIVFTGTSSSSFVRTVALTGFGLLPSDSPEPKASPGFSRLLASVAANCQSEGWKEGCCSTSARSSRGKPWGPVTRQEAEKSE